MDVIEYLTNRYFSLSWIIADIIVGILLVKGIGRWKLKNIAKIIGAEWGILFGGLAGFLIQDKMWTVSLGTVIGVTAFLLVAAFSEYGGKFIISFIFVFKAFYIFLNPIFSRIYRNAVDGGKYKYTIVEIKINEDTYLMLGVLLVSLILAIGFTIQKRNQNIYIFFVLFIAMSQIFGTFSAWYIDDMIAGPGYGEYYWSDWVWGFLPRMTVKYDEILWGLFILGVTLGIYVKKKLWDGIYDEE